MLKKLFAVSFFYVLFSSNLSAQIQLALEFNRDTFIQHEAIDLTLHVINNTGTQLNFGNNQGKIEFLIVSEVSNWSKQVDPYKKKDANGKLKKPFNPAAGLILGAGETKKLTIRLNRHFPLSKAVKYRILARLSHNRLTKAMQTAKHKEIEVVEGNLVETRTFGVADDVDPKKINTRKYSLIGFNVKNIDRYCLKIHDDKWVYALHRVGPKVHGITPQHDVDSFSNIHILIQLEPKIFLHTIFSPEGKKQQEVIYKASFDNVPKLKRDAEIGKISVVNGLKAVEGVDYVKQGDHFKMIN